jgi:hypothetical protein
LFLQVSPGETSLIQVLSKKNLEVVFLEKSLIDEKVHSLSVALEPLAVGIKSWRVLKILIRRTEKSLLRIYPVAPKPISGFFF